MVALRVSPWNWLSYEVDGSEGAVDSEASLALLPSGGVAVAYSYYGWTNPPPSTSLRYATGAPFSHEIVDSAEGCYVGQGSSLAFKGSGLPAISYVKTHMVYGSPCDGVYYAESNGATWSITSFPGATAAVPTRLVVLPDDQPGIVHPGWFAEFTWRDCNGWHTVETPAADGGSFDAALLPGGTGVSLCGTTYGGLKYFVGRRCPKGDLNCDGTVSFDDINPFVLALGNPNLYALQYPECNVLNADIDCDGDVDFDDQDPFVALLIGL
jgi:hypothetical protein